jgi:hypothetical protein
LAITPEDVFGPRGERPAEHGRVGDPLARQVVELEQAVAERPVRPLELADVLRPVAGLRRPPPAVNQCVAAAGVVERLPAGVGRQHGELPHPRVPPAEREAVGVVILEVVDERREEDGFAGVVQPDHADPALGGLHPQDAHARPRYRGRIVAATLFAAVPDCLTFRRRAPTIRR